MDSDTQPSSSESQDENVAGPSQPSYYENNTYKWSRYPSAPSRTRHYNIVRHRPGLIGLAASKIKIAITQSFELLIDDDIIQIINDYTNERITENLQKTTTDAFWTNYVSVTEMKAIIDLLLLTGVFK